MAGLYTREALRYHSGIAIYRVLPNDARCRFLRVWEIMEGFEIIEGVDVQSDGTVTSSCECGI